MQVTSAEDEELEGDIGGDSDGSGGDSDNEREKFKCKDASATPQLARFWHMLTSNAVYTAEKVSGFARLGDILFVIVAGSVEDERLFSAASVVLSKRRRRLDNSLMYVCGGRCKACLVWTTSRASARLSSGKRRSLARGAISVEWSRLACQVHARAVKLKLSQVMAVV
jgi:ferredoxin